MPQLLFAAALAAAPTLGWKLVVVLAQFAFNSHQQRQAERESIAEYNRSLVDRLEMVDVLPNAPRTLALGRVRAVEGVRRRWVSGTHSEKLTLIVSFAGHRIDGFEKWFFDDTEVELDGDGWVVTAPYAKTNKTSEVDLLDWPGGSPTITLAHVPILGTVSAMWFVGDSNSGAITVVSVSGSNVTLADGPAPGTSVQIHYQTNNSKSTARIRPYLGLASQNVGADLAAEYPGKITSADRFAGIALAVVDFLYDTDVYPQGRPSVTALYRGARCYDPRKDSTQPGGSGSHRANDESTWEWTENSGLCAGRYASWAHGFGLPIAELPVGDVVAAANASDVSTTFTLRKSDDSTTTVTLPRYRCGIVISSAADPRVSMDEILRTMAGRSGWAGGQWRFRAGTVASPSFTLTPAWLAQVLGPDGEPTGAAPITMSNGVTRDQKVNRVSGSCVDPDQRWQMLPFPAVQDATLIAAQGEYPAEVVYQGVNHIAHAQHLGTVAIRENQAALRIQATCNLLAYRCQLFDVGAVQLPRYGMTPELGKQAEVQGWRWHPQQGVVLQLAEISADCYTPVAELVGRDPAPDSALPSIRQVNELTITGITSGTEALTDGSLLTRTKVAWGMSDQESIRQGGQIEVQYIEGVSALPAGDWPSWMEAGDATDATLPGLLTGHWYVFRVRAVKPMLGVRGPWSKQVAHQVAMPPPLPAGPPGVGMLTLASTGSVEVTGGDAIKTADGGAWNAQVYSLEAYAGGAFVSFQADTPRFILGLNTDPTASASYLTIDYGWHVDLSGNANVYESGSLVSAHTGHTTATVFGVLYDGQTVRYTMNGVVKETTPAPAGLVLALDSSFYDVGALAKNLRFGPMGEAGAAAVAASVDRVGVNLTADSDGIVDAGQLPVAIVATVRLGAVDDTTNWTITRSSTSGITTTISGATVTITAVADALDSGTVTFTAAKAGQPDVDIIVPVSKTKRAVPSAYPKAFGFDLTNGVIINASASAYARLNSDGTLDTSLNGSSWTAAGNWYSPTTSGIGSSYRVADTVTGSALTAGDTPSFVSLASGHTFQLTQAPGGPGTYLEKRSALTIRIADNSSTTPLAVGYGALYVYVDRT